MDSIPDEIVILAILRQQLTIKDILSLATVSIRFNSLVTNDNANKQFANYYGLPSKFKLVEMKKYENMLLENRLVESTKISNIELFEITVELCQKRIEEEFPSFKLKYNPYLNYDNLALIAAKHGNIEFLSLMLECGASDYNSIILKAASKGRDQIVDFVIEKGGDDVDFDYLSDCIGEEITDPLYSLHFAEKIINLRDSSNVKYEVKTSIEASLKLIELDFSNLDNELIHAALEGNHKLFSSLCEKLEGDFPEWILRYAAKGGNLDIVNKCLEEISFETYNSIIECNYAYLAAIKEDHIEIAKLLTKFINGKGYSHAHLVIKNKAFCFKSLEGLKLLLEHEEDYDVLMYQAAALGNLEMIDLLISLGATDFNKAMVKAAVKGHVEVVKFMIQKGSNNFTEVLNHVVITKNIEIVIMILRLGAMDYTRALMYIVDAEDLTSMYIGNADLMLALGAEVNDYILEVAYGDLDDLVRSYM